MNWMDALKREALPSSRKRLFDGHMTHETDNEEAIFLEALF